MAVQPVLIAGEWRAAKSAGTFRADNPALAQPMPEEFPVSGWADVEAALDAAAAAFVELQQTPPSKLAAFLNDYAARIEAAKDVLVEMAHQETALPKAPRLGEVELPRTTNQLRQAAAAAIDGSWALPTIDTKANIRSALAAIGPVAVFGPNNFPFAFNSVAGGDFAAAIAAGNPVIAKANSSHPGTTKLLAELAHAAAQAAGLPRGTVQLIYRTSHDDGRRLASDPRLGSLGYTGSRRAGLELKEAADRVGKPIFLELSSVNPVVILPAALAEKHDALVGEFCTSCLMGTGQFCTNPGLVILLAGSETNAFVAAVAEKFKTAPVGTLLSKGTAESLAKAVMTLKKAGAEILAGGTAGGGKGHSFANTLLKVSGAEFVIAPEALQTEAFGNASLFVIAEDLDEAAGVLEGLEGNLTGCIYSGVDGGDDAAYVRLAPILRRKVGRLLNDKMPTGVAVSSAMNHGGPFPATGHPGFTAVGIPAALRRFAALHCYDGVRPERLPPLLANKNPTGKTARLIDGVWSTADV